MALVRRGFVANCARYAASNVFALFFDTVVMLSLRMERKEQVTRLRGHYSRDACDPGIIARPLGSGLI